MEKINKNLNKMKKNLLFFTIIAVMFLSSCSNDDDDVMDVNKDLDIEQLYNLRDASYDEVKAALPNPITDAEALGFKFLVYSFHTTEGDWVFKIDFNAYDNVIDISGGTIDDYTYDEYIAYGKKICDEIDAITPLNFINSILDTPSIFEVSSTTSDAWEDVRQNPITDDEASFRLSWYYGLHKIKESLQDNEIKIVIEKK